MQLLNDLGDFSYLETQLPGLCNNFFNPKSFLVAMASKLWTLA
ncbi:hypothetical protein [Neomoorella glycerini]|nr:hypothetical protein [Moorella glycerini]